ncbi:MAG TPA: methyl-accepting chemotaxis protein [Spirochaetota bacterium]|nr:methyl-accepting chemotaxis protein [Spirochaetota bacterium]
MKWFNNLRVSLKVMLSCLVLILLMGVIALSGIISQRDASVRFERFYNKEFMPVRYMNRTVRNILQLRINMLQEYESARLGDWDEVKKRMENSKSLHAEYMDLFEKYKKTILSEEETKLVREWEQAEAAPQDIRVQFEKSIMEKDFENAKRLSGEWLVAFNALRDKSDEMIESKTKSAEHDMKMQMEESRRAVIISVILLIASIVVGIVITIVLSGAVAGPVRKGLAFAEKLAGGDFTSRIDLDQNDELGMLGKALNAAADDLERLISEILAAAQNLSQAVDQISGGNQNLSQRTSEQASSLEEIASTIEEATAAIRQNADNSDQANKLSGETMKMAEEGNRVVMEAVASINEINKSSKKIEEIISVINEIAFQTNLLALNAAVEAARAGEQGRGFAVVAGEVRNLAQRSGNAAKEIGALIKDSTDKIETGTDLANRSGDALREIVGAMKNVARLVSEIAAASQEQKQGLDQINIAVSEMDSMTQQNAALVEETASASEEMAGQAREMQSMVERFKISEGTRGNVYQTKHKEVHLKAAAAAVRKPRGPETAPKREAVAATTERRKPVEDKKPVAGRDIKEVLREEGFEEF